MKLLLPSFIQYLLNENKELKHQTLYQHLCDNRILLSEELNSYLLIIKDSSDHCEFNEFLFKSIIIISDNRRYNNNKFSSNLNHNDISKEIESNVRYQSFITDIVTNQIENYDNILCHKADKVYLHTLLSFILSNGHLYRLYAHSHFSLISDILIQDIFIVFSPNSNQFIQISGTPVLDLRTPNITKPTTNHNNNNNSKLKNGNIKFKNNSKTIEIVDFKSIKLHQHLFYSKCKSKLNPFYFINTLKVNSKRSSRKLIWYIFSCNFQCFSKSHPPPSNIRIDNGFLPMVSLFTKVLSNLKSIPYGAILNSMVIQYKQKLPSSQSQSSSSRTSSQSLRNKIESLIHKNIAMNVVCNWLVTITMKLFDNRDEVWGCLHNEKQMFHQVSLFIRMSKYQEMSIDGILQGFQLEKFFGGRYNSVVVAKFLWWLFECIYTPLIINYFYRTETGVGSGYYLKSDWFQLESLQMEQYSLHFNEIPCDEKHISLNRSFGPISLRFVPKNSQMRPILNSSKKEKQILVSTSGYSFKSLTFSKSVNWELSRAILPVLNYEIKNQPHLLGYSVMSKTKLLHDFIGIKDEFMKLKMEGVDVCFQVLDIQKCYDNIQQDKLLSVLKKHVFQSDKYTLNRLAAIETSKSIICKIIAQSNSSRDSPTLQQIVKRNFPVKDIKNGLVVQVQKYPIMQITKQALENRLFNEFLKGNLVELNHTFYQMSMGIPQGSNISTILCCLYLGDFDNHVLSPKFQKENTFNYVGRFIDDYLQITTSVQNLNTLQYLLTSQNNNDYNLSCNSGKSKNYISQHSNRGCIVKDGNYFIPWCGFLINVHTLEFQFDYSRIKHMKQLFISIPHPNSWKKSLLKFLEHHSCIDLILLHSKLNSKNTIIVNIYQSLLFISIKFVSWVLQFDSQFSLGLSALTKQLHSRLPINICIDIHFKYSY
ncbi:hypothetical protein DLAC_00648 [Tieghemostelium lacteum]|uniref:Telomerase reverse transcriptase n=1 Tax=Tieghemostelium lacteum TaxID=361077 RepID=A0A152AA99_TIELA|nr:hypothetical protein DLAC_00648 [Tieghemostelium lacteum]|eukprot:KYR03148.1 hypothetical protein DLAC_00648 [Tieghemostelium lacteum]